MEQRPIQPMHHRHPGRRPRRRPHPVRLGTFERAIETGATAADADAVGIGRTRNPVRFAGSAGLFEVARPLAPQLALILLVLGRGGGGRGPADLGNGEDGFPAVEDGAVVRRAGVAEAGGGEGALGPAVGDAGEVPIDLLGAGVAIELVAHVNQVLDGSDVDVVDRGEVKDDGFEGGFGGVVGRGAVATWAGVIPGAILLEEGVSGFPRRLYSEERLTPSLG